MELKEKKGSPTSISDSVGNDRTIGQRRTYSERNNSNQSSSSKRATGTYFLQEEENLDPIASSHMDCSLPLSLEELEEEEESSDDESTSEWHIYSNELSQKEILFTTAHSFYSLPELLVEQPKAAPLMEPPATLHPKAESTICTLPSETEKKKITQNEDAFFTNSDYFLLLPDARRAIAQAQNSSLSKKQTLKTRCAARAVHNILNTIFEATDGRLFEHAKKCELLLTLAEYAFITNDASLLRAITHFQEQKFIDEVAEAHNSLEEIIANCDAAQYLHLITTLQYQSKKDAFEAAASRLALPLAVADMPLASARALAKQNLLETMASTLDFFDTAAKNLPLNTKED